MTARPGRSDSRTRLMQAAERLFAERGVRAVSIRDIAAEAGVNSALIAYHFGSKEELFYTVYRSVAEPMNIERTRRLDALERLEQPPTVEDLLDAWARPVLVDQAAADHARFAKLALALAAHDPIISNRLASDTFHEVNERFLDMMQRSLPDVPRKALVWRLYFLIGGVMMSARRIDRGMGSLSLGACNPADAEEMYRELLAYAAAGFRALSNYR
ncbi:MAG: TetR/AcrR family transcriptional regulator [Candidatus Eiseniibacteriota bacterium]